MTDLAGIVDRLELRPAHIVGHSYGATVALLLALQHPELCRSVTVHEPPAFGLLKHLNPELLDQVRRRMEEVVRPTEDEVEKGTRMFVDEVGFGPGTWERVLSPRLRRTFIAHADTWLDQSRDPDRLAVGTDQLARIAVPTLITRGDRSLPWYPPVVNVLAQSIPDARGRPQLGG